MMHDYKHEHPKRFADRDPIAAAELRGLLVGLLYGIALGIVIFSPLWAQLLDQ